MGWRVIIIVEIKSDIVIKHWIEIIEWLAENVGKCFSYNLTQEMIKRTNLETFISNDSDYMITNPISHYNFHFKNSEKAMLFKLIWA